MSGLLYKSLKLATTAGFVRRRLAHFAVNELASDLPIGIPVGYGLQSPLFSNHFADSFNEVFIDHEYDAILDLIKIPSTWLDLGCHAGFFSLWLMSQRLKRNLPSRECNAILVDADPSAVTQARKLIEWNGLNQAFKIIHGAVTHSGVETQVKFVVRPLMASSLADESPLEGHILSVPSLSVDQLLQQAPRELDLIKIDVEGAELDFFIHYQTLIKYSRYVLVEWHARSGSENRRSEVLALAEKIGFRLLSNIGNEKQMPNLTAGVMLFERH
jgi:FkbM family methyltransferase